MYLLHTKGNYFKIFLEDILKTDVTCVRNLCSISRRTPPQNFGLGRVTRYTVALVKGRGRINCSVGCRRGTRQFLVNSCTGSSGNIPLVKPKRFLGPRSKVRWGFGGLYKMDGRVVC
jgi:hypothetical protein